MSNANTPRSSNAEFNDFNSFSLRGLTRMPSKLGEKQSLNFFVRSAVLRNRAPWLAVSRDTGRSWAILRPNKARDKVELRTLAQSFQCLFSCSVRWLAFYVLVEPSNFLWRMLCAVTLNMSSSCLGRSVERKTVSSVSNERTTAFSWWECNVTGVATLHQSRLCCVCSVGRLVQHSNGSQYAVLIGLNNMSIHNHFIQNHVHFIKAEHDLLNKNRQLRKVFGGKRTCWEGH